MLEEVFQVGMLGVVTTFLVVLLKQQKPEFALPVAVLGCLIMSGLLIRGLHSLLHSFLSLADRTSLSGQELTTLLKIMGLAYVTDFVAGLCRDAGQGSVAAKVELAGRCGIVFLSLPLAATLLETVSVLFL